MLVKARRPKMRSLEVRNWKKASPLLLTKLINPITIITILFNVQLSSRKMSILINFCTNPPGPAQVPVSFNRSVPFRCFYLLLPTGIITSGEASSPSISATSPSSKAPITTVDKPRDFTCRDMFWAICPASICT